MKRLVLPRMRDGDNVADAVNRLALALEQQASRTPSGRPYTVAHPVEARTLDVSGTAADGLKVLGTLIADLQAGGSIG
jgi:hypothetical protein